MHAVRKLMTSISIIIKIKKGFSKIKLSIIDDEGPEITNLEFIILS